MRAESREPAQYHGEPSQRSPVLAFLLTLLCPGLGAAYLGKPLRGLLTCLLFVCGAGAFVSAWTELKFFPALPLLVLLSGWAVLAVLLGADAAQSARRAGSSYILVGANHLVVYATIFLLAFALPLLVLTHHTGTRLWTLVWVRGDSMYPTLVDGDLLLVDRTAYYEATPNAGDLVLFRDQPGAGGELLLGRIIGLPNDEIGIRGASPLIEGVPLPRLLLTGLGSDDHDPAFAGLPDVVGVPLGTVTFSEVNRDAGYLVAESPGTMGTVFEPFRLGEEDYYILFDNRGRLGDSRELGPVLRSQIVGEALFIAFSRARDHLCPPPLQTEVFSCEGAIRWDRVARRTEPTPTTF